MMTAADIDALMKKVGFEPTHTVTIAVADFDDLCQAARAGLQRVDPDTQLMDWLKATEREVDRLINGDTRHLPDKDKLFRLTQYVRDLAQIMVCTR